MHSWNQSIPKCSWVPWQLWQNFSPLFCSKIPRMDHNILGSALCPPDTQKVTGIMWSHTLSRDFLGFLALFYHNLRWQQQMHFCSQMPSCFAFWLLPFEPLASSRCLTQVEANLSCSGVCWPGCTHTLLSPWIPSLLDFQRYPWPLWSHSLPTLKMGTAENLIITLVPNLLFQNTNFSTCGDRVLIKTLHS